MNNLHCICLFALSLILFFLGGWLIPITDPTECCYTLTAKEMLAAGDWLSPRIYGDFWFDKPIMFYWELLVAYKIFGVGEFASRFFPAVFATGEIFLTYFFGAKLYNRKIGFVAAVMLATSLEFWYLSHAVITDMTLLFAFSLTLITFFLGYRANNPKLYLLSFASSGVAVLTKGPIGFFLPGLIILIFLAWQGDLKQLRKLFRVKNVLVFAVIVALWYLPMTILHGTAFVENFLGVHNFLRATVSEYAKTDVWYYYALISAIGFLPWSIPLIPAAVVKFFRRAELFIEEGRLPVFDVHEKFLIVWALTVVIFFQLCATKYVTYTLPAMPPAMIFLARYFANRWKLFLSMTGATLIIFSLALFTVALPLAEDNSGRREAEIISPLVDEKTCVVSHGKNYSGSLVFYSGLKVFRLETKENYELIRPQALTWSSKNVMPFMTFDELPSDKKILAIVAVDAEKIFFDNVKGDWELVGTVPKGSLETFAEEFFLGKTSEQKLKCKIYRRAQIKSDNKN
ncbi:MAG: glycosyltransferase family 39 protein, partial [Selenomonadaceae bacterium]|nr:glycosyltransferase family 39 protein [Selenomonadaceae bacterium]